MGYKFYYFNLYVRGEPIRMMLEQSGETWEDKVITFPEWGAIKPTMPNGQVPCLELEDGTKMGESLACLRFLAMKHGLYPEDPIEAAKCNEAMDYYEDLIGKIYTPHFEGDEAKKEATIKNIFENVMPAFLKAFDAQFAEDGFIAGANLSCADFCIGGIYTNFVANPDVSFAKEQWAALLVQFPNFKAYGERFAKECKWVQKRGTKYGV